ncbi:hypothetical protein U27_03219 [Candidatus Vecturithrix granuli]|uniref:Lcl C-terminal domain-containing protein n=1 Tax=Vecturithrix granuli TaxID=1499967 RepID=A0A081BVA2_VECG1|nr:hypothetical protein U27_03219 [Candidatus Vecturithrix granuli]
MLALMYKAFLVAAFFCVLTSCALLTPSPVLFLRSKPAQVSRVELIAFIQKYNFNHPANLSDAGLSGSVSGNFRHHYEVRMCANINVIVDKATNLMWPQVGSEERLTWMEAKDYVEHLNTTEFAGYRDWRLPTIEELASLLEFRKSPLQTLYLDPLFDQTQAICWSADILDSAANVWFVYFAHGYVSHTDADSRLYVRAVRSI